MRKRFHPRRFFAVPLVLAAAGWTVGNALVELASIFGRDRVLRVRYEDLIASPDDTLDRIGDFLGTDLGDLKRRIDDGRAFEIGHNIGRNQMRMTGSFRLNQDIGRKADLPRGYRLAVLILCLPLMARYGYISSPERRSGGSSALT